MDRNPNIFSGSSGSSRSSTNAPPAYEIGTKSGLTELFNKKVVSAQEIHRDMNNSSGGLSGMAGFPHKGVALTLEDGREFLAHSTGADVGSAGMPVITGANRSSNWKNVGESVTPSNMTVGNFKEAGGSEPYKLLGNNCYNSTNRMMDAAKDNAK